MPIIQKLKRHIRKHTDGGLPLLQGANVSPVTGKSYCSFDVDTCIYVSRGGRLLPTRAADGPFSSFTSLILAPCLITLLNTVIR